MNLAEVLNVALPELPAKRIGKAYRRLHPRLIAREQIEGGVPTVVAMVSGGSFIMRFTPDQWKLVQLFNGERSYVEVAELFEQEIGVSFTEQEVREFADSLEEAEIWYRSPLELSTTANEKLADERRRRAKKTIDLSMMTFSTWDPDRLPHSTPRAPEFHVHKVVHLPDPGNVLGHGTHLHQRME